MTGEEVKAIREQLGEVIGRRLSQHELGIVLGLAPANAARAIRTWEDEAPTGPGATALTLMADLIRLGHADHVRQLIASRLR